MTKPTLSPAPARLDLSADYWLVLHVSTDVVLRFDTATVRAWRNESHWHRVREGKLQFVRRTTTPLGNPCDVWGIPK